MALLKKNGFAVALAAGLGLALLAGVIYSISADSRRVAPQARTLHAVHETIQSATVARGQFELAGYQALLSAGGVNVDAAAVRTATARGQVAAAAAVDAHGTLLELRSSSPQLVFAIAEFEAAANRAGGALDAGAVAATGELEIAYHRLMEELTPLRDELLASVGGDDRAIGFTAAVAGFLAVFVIPAAVISTYFVLDRRRRRQHELEVVLEAERAAQASRERFLTTVSRELQRPLNGVRGIAQMIEADRALLRQPRMSDMHALLVGELDDMSGIVEDLLTASRLESSELDYSIEPVDVRFEAHLLVESLNHRGAAIYVAMDEGIVNADRRRLRQIVRNLLTNAIKYGGPNIEIKGHAVADSYTVVVVDDGQGVPRDVEEHLFTRFVHGEDSAQSVGLGLSIVMALAVGMGGTAFHERVDGLTRFGVRLPTAATASVSAQESDEPPADEPEADEAVAEPAAPGSSN